jgi:hypothetical protein
VLPPSLLEVSARFDVAEELSSGVVVVFTSEE